METFGHFYSDYQHIYRDFVRLERQAKALLAIDPETHPARFEVKLDDLIAGRDSHEDRAVLATLVAPEDD